VLDNNYYKQLLNFDQWTLILEDNPAPSPFPDQFYWEEEIAEDSGIFMLHADMSLAFDMVNHLEPSNGAVNCTLVPTAGQDVCPESSMRAQAQLYADDNNVFMQDFEAAFLKMVNIGCDGVNICTAVPPSIVPAPTPLTPAPVSKAPVSKAPVSKAPVSKAPVSKAPVSKAPVSKAPVSKAPVSKAPVSKAPVSKAPVSKAPVSKAPVSKAPVSKAPVSKAPVSKAPVSKAPVSKAPVSKAPVSKAPVSKAPVSKAPVKAPTKRPTKAPTRAPVSLTVTNFQLINADTDEVILNLANNAIISCNFYRTTKFNVVALTNQNQTRIGSVRFALTTVSGTTTTKNTNFRTENRAPFALAGDNLIGTRSDFFPWTPVVGKHTVKATPFPQTNAGGAAGIAQTVTFNVTA
jgi:hypothetical protein